MTTPVVLDGRVVTGTGGGPEKTILKSPRFLEPFGYRMLCAYLHPPGDPGFDHLRRKAAGYGAELHSVPDRGPWDWRVVGRLAELCRRHRVAVWHGHDYKSNALGLLLRRVWPMRLVTTVHGWVRHTRRTPLYYAVDRVCLPRYERVISVSADLDAACAGCGVPAARRLVIENGVDGDEYRRTRPAAEAKQALGLPADVPLVGAVGRLSPEKGFDVLIDAVAALPGVHLAVAGEGDDRPRLERLMADRLGSRGRLLGFVADPRPLYEATDVYALSSLREGLPNVVLEAMATGVPVVATRVAGVPTLIDHGVNGLLADPGSAADLAARLREALNAPAALGPAGRATVEARFGFRERTRRVAAVYDELLAA